MVALARSERSPVAASPVSPATGDSTPRRPESVGEEILLCQACQPAIRAVDASQGGPCREPLWRDWKPQPFDTYFQGEYIGPARMAHLTEYRLRVDDQLEFVYRLTRESDGLPYLFDIGDRIKVEVSGDKDINHELEIQPDGTLHAPYLEPIRAEGLTAVALRKALLDKYMHLYPTSVVIVTPMKVGTKLEDLRAAVDRRAGAGGQDRAARVTPEGTVQLPAIGSLQAQGLTLDELKYEVDERYRQIVHGLEVTPVLVQRAPTYVFVLGDVKNPGRFTLERPTTVMGGLALAGSWLNGGNLRQVVVFRRTDDWRLIATKLDVRGALYAQRPCPADDIYLRDADVIVVPKSAIKALDESIELLFTRGLYAALPGTTGFRPFTLTTFD